MAKITNFPIKLLAFDTSSAACSVAIQNGSRIETLHKIAPMQQAKLILPMIQELLKTLDISLDSLDAIIYGCGPGSFTGIRIACSVAQGVGFAIGKPVIPVSSLAALAQSAYMEHHCQKQMVAIDARMGQVYWALYQQDKSGCAELIGNELVCEPGQLHAPEGRGWSATGDGWLSYRQSLETQLGFMPDNIYPSQLPTAMALLQLGRSKFEQEKWVSATEAIPVYLR
jgi:tRNA threonylcarbamoyladenosine biosynthesis protein TsaB